MLTHFARKNAQFVARFYSFGSKTSHRDVSAAQGDAEYDVFISIKSYFSIFFGRTFFSCFTRVTLSQLACGKQDNLGLLSNGSTFCYAKAPSLR